MSGLVQLTPGAAFAGDYRVEKPLSEGGMGLKRLRALVLAHNQCSARAPRGGRGDGG